MNYRRFDPQTLHTEPPSAWRSEGFAEDLLDTPPSTDRWQALECLVAAAPLMGLLVPMVAPWIRH